MFRSGEYCEYKMDSFRKGVGLSRQCQQGMASVPEDTASEKPCSHQFNLLLASECG